MTRVLFLCAKPDLWRARVVSSKWEGEGREGVISTGLVSVDGRVDVDAVAVLLTGSSQQDADVSAAVRVLRTEATPIVWVDVSRIPDEAGEYAVGPGQPGTSELLYRWNLDNGKYDLPEWIEAARRSDLSSGTA